MIKVTHDTLFKTSMENIKIAKDFYKSHLPDSILSEINLNTLAISNVEMYDVGFRSLRSDIIHTVKLKDQDGLIFCHCEQQTQPDKLIAFRMWEYMLAIMRRYVSVTKSKVLPVVIPLIVYTGKSAYPYSTSLLDLFDPSCQDIAKQVLNGSIQLIDLARTSDEELQTHLTASLFEYAMKHIWHDGFDALMKELIVSMELFYKQGTLSHDEALKILNTILYYVIEYNKNINEQALNDTVSFIAKRLPADFGEEVMNIREQWYEEGRTDGVLQGIEQGIEQGIKTGENRIKRVAAIKLSRNGIAPNVIAQSLDVSLNELENLIGEINPQ